MATAKKRDFEAELRKLEEIVSAMEEGQPSLDEALKLYEKGMELSRFCLKYLGEAETRVEALNKKGVLKNFDSAVQDKDDSASDIDDDESESVDEEENELLF